jgi:hypothetical protein
VVLNPAPNLKVLGLLQVKNLSINFKYPLRVGCLSAKALYAVQTDCRVLLLDLCSAFPF